MNTIPTTIAATLFIQIGYFLWKVSAQNQAKTVGSSIRAGIYSQLIDWRWGLGFVSTSLGWLLFVNATAIGDISLIQPLMSAGDFFLVIMAVIFLKERLGVMEWIGLVVTIIGSLVLVWNPTNSDTNDFDNLYLITFLGGIVITVSLLVWMNFRRRSQSNFSEIYLALVVGLCFGTGALLTKALTISSKGFSWAIVSNPLLFAMLLANVIGLILLQIAFRSGRAAVIVPVQLAVANGVAVLAGFSIFAEHLDAFRMSGIVLVLIGAVFLQLKSPPENRRAM